MASPKTSYDEIPYPSISFPETHPARLAAVARIFGLETPAADRCRVLELGCSMGGNLLALAQIHPGCQCVGLDASSHQIAEGWKTIHALGVKNVQLRHMDILEVDDDLGEFDYIISHGVYSWVPPRVQAKILDICRRHLARNGVAYVSYNTYPGWHIRGVIRDMMFYRGAQFADANAQLAQAKSLVSFVAQASSKSDSPYQRLLQSELKQLDKMTDYYLHHEYLEEHNQPLYFHEFAKKLAVNGLQYLGDAEFSTMISSNFSPDTARTLHEMGAHDIVQMEQYMDFVRCRFFRKTLICHNGIQLNRAIDSAIVTRLLLASAAAPVEAPVLDAASPVTYQTLSGNRIVCKAPLTKLAMRVLQREWPVPVTYAALLESCVQEARSEGLTLEEGLDDNFLAGEMLTAIGAGVVEMRVSDVAYARTAGHRPRTTALARWQAGSGYQVTNLRGEAINLDEIHRQTLRLLDGSRDAGQLSEAMLDSLRARVFTLRADSDGKPVTEEAAMRALLGPALNKVLHNLGTQAFLLADAA
jgi:methyltransferase-like protein/cyclopropane fatty-acyl-phospholipid synthase-like methyltransferase